MTTQPHGDQTPNPPPGHAEWLAQRDRQRQRRNELNQARKHGKTRQHARRLVAQRR